MKNVLVIISIISYLSFTNLLCQDSTSVEFRLKLLSQKVDSLQQLLDQKPQKSFPSLLNNSSKIDTTGKEEKSDDLLNQLTTILSFDEQVSSSKKGRINELLKLLRNSKGEINLSGNVTSILQSELREGGISTASASFDFFIFTRVGDFADLFIDLEAIGGNGPNENIPSHAAINGDAGSLQDEDGVDRLQVLEGWVEFKFLDEWFRFTLGKIDLSNYFDTNPIANDETMQFISGPFVNSAALPVPSNSPGIRVYANLGNLLFFQTGIASHNNSGNRIFNELFKIFSTNLVLEYSDKLQFNFHLYAYFDGAVKDADGYGLSFSHTFGNSFKLFGRWNLNNSAYANRFPVRSAWSGGFEFNPQFEKFNLIFGLAHGKINTFEITPKNESLSELYIRYEANK